MAESLNLLDEPWIRVTRLSGEPDEVSLVTAFEEASDISGICGEIASQDVAILRVLLAIVHRAMGGPKDIETFQNFWRPMRLCILSDIESDSMCAILWFPSSRWLTCVQLRRLSFMASRS